MKTEKMILKNINDVLSRDEMKMIMAGKVEVRKGCRGTCYGGSDGEPGICYRAFDERIFQCLCTATQTSC
jgi:hypothetical protein